MDWKPLLTAAALILGAVMAVYGIAADARGSPDGPIMMPEVLIQAPRPEVVLLPERLVTPPAHEMPLLPEVAVSAPRPEIVLLDTVRIDARRIELRDRSHGTGTVSSVRRIHARVRAAHASSDADHAVPVPGIGLRRVCSYPARDLGLCDRT